MPELPSGTLTVLHTEIEGSALLTVHLGDRYPQGDRILRRSGEHHQQIVFVKTT